MKGFYSLHVNALYDIDRRMYTDALLQPAHCKNEFRAFCTMVDRIPVPENEFPPKRLADLYFTRWKIESACRDLKYTIGMLSFHSCKAMFIEQEVLARLLAYNITEALVQSTVVETGDAKHEYKISLTRASHICRVFLRLPAEEDAIYCQ